MGIYVYILEMALDILEKLIHNSQNICGYDTECNADQTDILGNLFD